MTFSDNAHEDRIPSMLLSPVPDALTRHAKLSVLLLYKPTDTCIHIH